MVGDGAPEAAGRLVLAGIDGGAGTGAVLTVAGRLAALASTALLVVYVAPNPAALAPALLGPVPSDIDDLEAELFPTVVEALCHHAVEWRFTVATGHAGCELARLAEQHHALAVVVGADTPGCGSRLRRLTSGSVPAHLAHHQGVPVIVVPEALRRSKRPSATRVGEARNDRPTLP
jgi:nucleotide-binding universal stress UspA family protein